MKRFALFTTTLLTLLAVSTPALAADGAANKFSFGGMAYEEAALSLEAFAKDVLPRVAHSCAGV